MIKLFYLRAGCTVGEAGGGECHLHFRNALCTLHVVEDVTDSLSQLLALSAVPKLSQLVQGCVTIVVNTKLERYCESFVLSVLSVSAERRAPENGVSSCLQQLPAKG